MPDPTQQPPFLSTVLVENGIVTAFTGVANQHWIDENPGHVPFDPDDVSNRPHVGYGYADGVFEQPPTTTPLPAKEA